MCRLHKGAMSGDPDIADMGEMNPPFSTERADHGRKIVFGVGSQGTGAKGPAVAGAVDQPDQSLQTLLGRDDSRQTEN